MPRGDRSFFVFDCESAGLYGETFAVGGGIFLENGACQQSFMFACPIETDGADPSSLLWVRENVPQFVNTHRAARPMRSAFWAAWISARNRWPGIIMAAECLYPVEAGFIRRCVEDDGLRMTEAPYPFLEISSVMIAAGMDPLATYARTPTESPAHNPLADAMLSARLLADAFARLK